MAANFSDIQSQAQELKTGLSERVSLFHEMEEMFFMEPADEGKLRRAMENVKLTISPDARNALLGAVRLMTATDPTFTVPFDAENPAGEMQSGKVEKFAAKMWGAAGKVAGSPVHYDIVLSGLLYGEAHMGIIKTKELVKFASEQSPAHKARAERTARRTPYLFTPWSPKECYPMFDSQGLAAHYREVETTADQVISDWGTAGETAVGKAGKNKVTLGEWWDLENHLVWANGTQIINEVHGLPFIPIVCALTDGSERLFIDKPTHQRQPFLYTLAKSGLWNRKNLALTVLYTMIFAIGANPLFVFTSQQRDAPDVDFSIPGGLIKLQPQESYAPLVKNVIDPSIMQGMQLADEAITESTIYKQALGQPLGSSAAFSMVALLNQTGRLPLISQQRRLSWMIAQAMEIAFTWLKTDGGKNKAEYSGQISEISADEIPDDVSIEASLDISLAQDKLQAANIAAMLVQAGLVSQEWARQNVLNIGQSDDMTRQIWRERWSQQLAEQTAAQMGQQMQAAQQQPMQQPTPGMPPGMPPSIPSEGQQPGLVGLPPEMLAGGGQGPMNGGMPPGM